MENDTVKTAPKTSADPQRKKRALSVAVCCIVLLHALGGVLYLRATVQDRKPANSEIEQQSARNAALLGEKQRLDTMRGKAPCEIKDLLAKTGPADFKAKPLQMPPAPDASPASPVSPNPSPEPAKSPNSTQTTAPTAVSMVEDATVFILAFDQAGNIVTGSGFFFAPNLVLTNKHVAEKHEAGLFVINKKLNAPVQAKMIAMSVSPTRDYAVLQVSAPTGIGITPLPFSTSVQRAEKVGAWGYPHAVSKNDPKYRALMTGQVITAPELSYSDGSVSAIHESDPPRIVHTAPLSHGNSGGPLTDNSGNVLGINTLITLDNESYRQTSFALAASDILAFLKEHGMTPAQAK